jgi:hypothetical protein
MPRHNRGNAGRWDDEYELWLRRLRELEAELHEEWRNRSDDLDYLITDDDYNDQPEDDHQAEDADHPGDDQADDD